jgi:hypothetical protein
MCLKNEGNQARPDFRSDKERARCARQRCVSYMSVAGGIETFFFELCNVDTFKEQP